MPAAMATIEQATRLLDFSQKLDINLLDQVVSCFHLGQSAEVQNNYYFYNFKNYTFEAASA